MQPIRYGLTKHYRRQPTTQRRRHIVWAEHGSKCGLLLVEETTDTSIPMCRHCLTSMGRLERERARRSFA